MSLTLLSEKISCQTDVFLLCLALGTCKAMNLTQLDLVHTYLDSEMKLFTGHISVLRSECISLNIYICSMLTCPSQDRIVDGDHRVVCACAIMPKDIVLKYMYK